MKASQLHSLLDELIYKAEKVESVHAEKKDCPKGLAAKLKLIDSEIKTMPADSENLQPQLQSLKALADQFVLPEEACGTWRSLHKGLVDMNAQEEKGCCGICH